MRYYKATIEVLVCVSDEGEACDAIAEALRPILREFDDSSSWIDWRYADSGGYPVQHDGSGFEYAAAGMPGLVGYRVNLHENKGDKFTIVFECQAEDADHAAEQALNAYPAGEVTHIATA